MTPSPVMTTRRDEEAMAYAWRPAGSPAVRLPWTPLVWNYGWMPQGLYPVHSQLSARRR